MSEYQYYEFVAVDRPLDDRQQTEMRSLSTSARITATGFADEYHQDDFHGEPGELVERYYDAHLYLANWGTRRVVLRLPRGSLELDVAEQYCVGDQVMAWTVGEHLVLDLTSEDDPDERDVDVRESLSAIVGARAELAAGDHRPLYLAWLAGYGTWERDEDAFDRAQDAASEPPVPPGLRALTTAQRELADFLRLDEDLLAVAAEVSPPLREVTDEPDQLTDWVTNLPVTEKDQLLRRVVRDQAAVVRMELLRRFRDETTTPGPAPSHRTVADLLDGAAKRRTERQHRTAAQHAAKEE